MPEETIELEDLKTEKTEQVLDYLSDASGGIDHYASALGYPNQEDFLKDLRGKIVLDLGSGRGLLAKEVHLKGVDCQITSVEPKFALKGYRQDVEKMTREYLAKYAPPPKSAFRRFMDRIKGVEEQNSLDAAHKYHDENIVAAMAHALPFKDQSFDMIFDVTAVSRYTGRHESYGGQEEKPLFQLYLQEAMRALKPGGCLKIFDPDAYGWVEIGQEPKPSWKEEALKELGLDYKIIWSPEEKKFPLGVEVTKN